MNSRQRKTLEAIFHEPMLANIRWDAAAALLESLGASVRDAGGSMKAVQFNRVRAVFHRPHPGNEMSSALTRAVRKYLMELGIAPERREN